MIRYVCAVIDFPFVEGHTYVSRQHLGQLPGHVARATEQTALCQYAVVADHSGRRLRIKWNIIINLSSWQRQPNTMNRWIRCMWLWCTYSKCCCFKPQRHSLWLQPDSLHKTLKDVLATCPLTYFLLCSTTQCQPTLFWRYPSPAATSCSDLSALMCFKPICAYYGLVHLLCRCISFVSGGW